MRLPQPARILLPHQPPMVCIDRLLEAGEDRGLCEVRLVEGHTLLDAKGRLEPCGFVELAAQSVAALKGWERVRRGLPLPLGFLGAHRLLEGRPQAAHRQALHSARRIPSFEQPLRQYATLHVVD